MLHADSKDCNWPGGWVVVVRSRPEDSAGQLNRDLANHESYYWNRRSFNTLLLSVYQLHDRKGCKPRTRGNYLSIDAIHIDSHPRRANDRSVDASTSKLILRTPKRSAQFYEGRMAER